MTPPRRRGPLALVATALLTSACFGDMIEKFTSDMVDEHVPKPGSNKRKSPASARAAPLPVTIPEASRTPQCRAEMSAALDTMREELGLDIKVQDTHVDALFGDGTVAIPYARDGIRHIPSFRLQRNGEACALQFFKRATVRPGQSESTQADYGSVGLKVCTCQ